MLPDPPSFYRTKAVAIVGSREWPDPEMVRRFVDELAPQTLVISGGARGVDRLAETYARGRHLPMVTIRPDQGLLRAASPRVALLARNAEIVAAVKQLGGIVVAFWSHGSSGTRNAIATAVALGVPVHIFYPGGGDEWR